MHSNVVDLAEWVKLHLAGGSLNGMRFLKESTVREMQALHASLPITTEEKGMLPPFTGAWLRPSIGHLLSDFGMVFVVAPLPERVRTKSIVAPPCGTVALKGELFGSK
jgi:hypothetical protein